MAMSQHPDGIESHADDDIPDDVQERLEALQRENEALEARVDALSRRLETVIDLVIGPEAELVEDDIQPIPDQIEGVRDQLESEQQTRSQKDALLERKVGKLADQADASLTDEQIQDDDKISRVLRYGPGDVEGTVYPVHLRARDLLEHVAEWGHTAQDKFGKRITIRATTARNQLELKRDEDLKSSEVKRVFEKIEHWAEDSTRRVRTGKTPDGANKLVIYFNEGE